MKKVKILHRTPKGKIIGTINRQPKINSIIFLKNNSKTRLGKIYDVFGPVNKPYVKIIPFNEKAANEILKNSEVVILDSDNSNRKKRRAKKK